MVSVIILKDLIVWDSSLNLIQIQKTCKCMLWKKNQILKSMASKYIIAFNIK